jgi:ubiquitin-conjugating enzyme E2 S
LNEEAGKLLLEDFDSYANRAKLMTSIHAMKKGVSATCGDKDGSKGSGVLAPLSVKNNVSPQKRDLSSAEMADSKIQKKVSKNDKKGLKRL